MGLAMMPFKPLTEEEITGDREKWEAERKNWKPSPEYQKEVEDDADSNVFRLHGKHMRERQGEDKHRTDSTVAEPPEKERAFNLNNVADGTIRATYSEADGKIAVKEGYNAARVSPVEDIVVMSMDFPYPNWKPARLYLVFDLSNTTRDHFFRILDTIKFFSGSMDVLTAFQKADEEMQAATTGGISATDDPLLRELCMVIAFRRNAIRNAGHGEYRSRKVPATLMDLIKFLVEVGPPPVQTEQTKFLREYLNSGEHMLGLPLGVMAALIRHGWSIPPGGEVFPRLCYLRCKDDGDTDEGRRELFDAIASNKVYFTKTNKRSILSYLAQWGKPSMMEYALKTIDLNEFDEGEVVRLLSIASAWNKIDMVEFILDLGRDPNAVVDRHRSNTALHGAVDQRDAEKAKLLLDRGAKMVPDWYGKKTPLARARELDGHDGWRAGEVAALVKIFEDWLTERGLPFDHADEPNIVVVNPEVESDEPKSGEKVKS